MTYQLFIDDERYPPSKGEWVIVRSSAEAIQYVTDHGMPSFISFDHDLGGTDNAMIFVHWLVESHIDGKFDNFLPMGFDVHSQNPVGAKNIRGLLLGYLDSLGLL